MQDNNIFGSSQAPTAAPGPAPMPNPTPAPNPYQPNPYQPTPAGATPINPMGNTPKKSHTGLIIGIIAGVIVIATVLIVLFAVVLPNANKSKDGDKKDSNSSKTADKDKKGSGGDDSGGSGSGSGNDSGSSTSSGTITVTFNGKSMTIGRHFGENARTLAKIGDIYTSDDKKLSDLDGYLKKTYTFDMDRDIDERDELPSLDYKFDINDWDTPVIHVSGYYSSMGDNDNTKAYADLESYVSFWCGKNEKFTVEGKSFTCGKSKGTEVKTAFPSAKESYGNYEVKIGNYRIDFMFDDEESGGELNDIMVEYTEF